MYSPKIKTKQKYKSNLTLLQDVRPLGAVMISDCNIIHGCDDEFGDESAFAETSLEKQNSFKLRLTSGSKGNRFLCLASESKEDFAKWVNTIGISSQIPDDVSSQHSFLLGL